MKSGWLKSGSPKSGWRKGRLGVVMALGLMAAAPKIGGRVQETPPGVPTAPPPAAPLTLEQRVAELEALVNDQQREIDRLGRVSAGLVDGSAMIATAAEQALIKGFVEAGANPDARTELLNGLSGFADAVKVAAEPPKPPKKEAPAKK